MNICGCVECGDLSTLRVIAQEWLTLIFGTRSLTAVKGSLYGQVRYLCNMEGRLGLWLRKNEMVGGWTESHLISGSGLWLEAHKTELLTEPTHGGGARGTPEQVR